MNIEDGLSAGVSAAVGVFFPFLHSLCFFRNNSSPSTTKNDFITLKRDVGEGFQGSSAARDVRQQRCVVYRASGLSENQNQCCC